MSNQRSRRFWALLTIGIMLGGALGFGGGYLVGATTALGSWSGSWFTEANGNFTSSFKLPFLTAGRVPFVGVGGFLADNAGLQFNSATGTLTATKLGATTLAGNLAGGGYSATGLNWVNATSSSVSNLYANTTLYIGGNKYYNASESSYLFWGSPAAAPTMYYARSGVAGTTTNDADAATLFQTLIASNKQIFVKNGNYNFNSAIISINGVSNLKIVGESLLARFYSTRNSNIINIDTCTNIVIDGLYLQGSASAGSQSGISAYNSINNLVIKNCRIEDMGYDGINLLMGCIGTRILNNYIINCHDDGINPGGGGSPTSYTTGTIVSDNYISGITNNGIHISTMSKFTICSDNQIWNCGQGVGFYNSSYNTVSDNQIYNTRTGITTLNGVCESLIITDNKIVTTTADFGIYLNHLSKNSIISDNSIYNTASYAIKIDGGSDKIQIIGNNIRTGTRAIYVVSSLYGIISDNIIDTPTEFGIVISANAGTYAIEGNNIRGGCASAGIYLGGYGANQVKNNVITGTGGVSINDTTGNNYISGNQGYVTEKGGTATILIHTSSLVVNHGLSYTPSLSDFSLVFNSGGTQNCTSVSISSITSTQFTLTCLDNTGTAKWTSGAITIGWKCIKTP